MSYEDLCEVSFFLLKKENMKMITAGTGIDGHQPLSDESSVMWEQDYEELSLNNTFWCQLPANCKVP